MSTGGPAAYHAFVPAPVPREHQIPPETIMLLSEADSALGRLAGAGRLLPDPHLLVTAYITREAVASSRIEGTQASVTEIFDAAVTGISDRGDIQEVSNYIIALQHGLRRLEEGFPISLRLIKEMHQLLLTNVRGQERTPGEFRRSQNWISSPDNQPRTARFVPPVVEEMWRALDDWEKYLHDDSTPKPKRSRRPPAAWSHQPRRKSSSRCGLLRDRDRMRSRNPSRGLGRKRAQRPAKRRPPFLRQPRVTLEDATRLDRQRRHQLGFIDPPQHTLLRGLPRQALIPLGFSNGPRQTRRAFHTATLSREPGEWPRFNANPSVSVGARSHGTQLHHGGLPIQPHTQTALYPIDRIPPGLRPEIHCHLLHRSHWGTRENVDTVTV